MKRVILLDADIVAYNISAKSQQTFDFGDTGVAVHVEDMADVERVVETWVARLIIRLKADELIVCLSVPSSEGFRLKVLPTYKFNRKAEKPRHLQAVKDYLASEYKSYTKPQLEADDVMGILATHPLLISGKKVIVSEDKDMQTIPCWLFRPKRDTKPWLVSEEHANWFHMIQTLMGDPCDGYKGCPLIGIKSAEMILASCAPDKHWSAVVRTYKAAGLTEDDALVQAQVARICRHDDYDFNSGEVKLWTPSKS